jgi:predicted transposase YbfD/YdcC
VLAVKGNQETLCKELAAYFEDADILRGIGQYRNEFEKAHGQLETREYWQSGKVSWLRAKKRNGKDKEGGSGWAGLASIGMTKTSCFNLATGKTSEQRRYYLSSLPPDIMEFMRAVRGHWSVESMHWHLDVTFREDKNRTLDKNAAESLNIIRKWALSILKIADLGQKLSLKKSVSSSTATRRSICR